MHVTWLRVQLALERAVGPQLPPRRQNQACVHTSAMTNVYSKTSYMFPMRVSEYSSHTTNRLALPSPRYLVVPCLGLPRVLGRLGT